MNGLRRLIGNRILPLSERVFVLRGVFQTPGVRRYLRRMNNAHGIVVLTGASRVTEAGRGTRPVWRALLLVGACVVTACDQADPAPLAAARAAPPASQAAPPGAAQPAFQAAPPISGVLGKITAVATDSFDVQTKTGLVHVQTGGDLTTYEQAPSDLGHVTPSSFVGVPSVAQANGTEVAKQVMIFPPELRGAAEGSVLLDAPPGAAGPSRMTNGSVAGPPSRMTNGTVQNGDGATLVVQYQDGAQTISVPPNTPVTEIKPDRVKLEAGDVIYAATTKQPDGALTSNKVFVFIPAHSPG
jgi:hypothetical protein